MIHTNASEPKRTINPFLAMAAFPVMMANPLYAMYAGMSGVAYVAELMHSFHSVFLPKRKEDRSVQPDSETAKSGERSKLRLVPSRASKETSKEARRTARGKTAHGPKRGNQKAKGVAENPRTR